MEDLANELPKGWVAAKMTDIVSPDGVFSDGDWVETKDQDPNGDVRLIQLADIGEMQFLDKSRRHMTEAKAEELNCTFLQKGDLLISRLGDPLGKACVYPAGESRAVTAVDVCILRPGHQSIEPKLFGYFLNGWNLRRKIDQQSSGTTRKRITGKKLKALPVRVPPSNEQRRIVEKIETLFARLDKGEAALREVQKLLGRYRQSVLKAAVTGQLTADWRAENAHRLEHGRDLLARILQTRRENWQGRGKYKEPVAPDTTGLPELPEGWVWASLAQLAYIKGGVTVDKKREASDPVTLPYLRVANVQNGFLDLGEVKEITVDRDKAEQCLLEAGDILLNEGGDRDKLGRGWVWNGEIAPCIHQNHVFRARPIIEGISSKFISYYTNAFGQPFFMRKGKQSVNLASISLTAISTVAIPLPSTEEQMEIVTAIENKLADLERVWEATESELARSASLRQSILKDAFAGRLVPQDPSDEPASELLARIRAEHDNQPKKTRTSVK